MGQNQLGQGQSDETQIRYNQTNEHNLACDGPFYDIITPQCLNIDK